MEIDKIAGPLRKVLREREIIARCELLLRTYDIVRAADLCEEGREELQKIVGKKIAPGIFVSIMSKEPAFFDLPRLDTFTQMDGRIFHFLHTKKHSKQDFAEANRKFLNSMPELRRIMYQSLKDLLVEFMSDAGYRLTSEETGELVFSAPERKARAFVATSVRSLDIDKCRGEQGEDVVALVPSGENLEPFMQFYQENGLKAEEREIQIWVTNMEKGSIDPFVGYTMDLDIYNQFENPRLAEMVRNNWSRRKQF